MAIPIFWRLTLGNVVILLLSIAACFYSAVQLGILRNSARTALGRDQRMIGYQEILTDTFLSEFRYGGKYIITRTESRYEPLRQFKDDFARYMRELKSLTQSEETTALLARIERNHSQYHELFDQEVAYIRANQSYAQTRYQQEREKTLESLLGELGRLKDQLRLGLQDKIVGMDRAATTARRITMAATLIVSLLGILLSLKISKSVTLSLKDLKRRTESSLPVSDSQWIAKQLPEIQELARAFDQKLTALRDQAAHDAGVINQMTDELMPQLISLQNRLQQVRGKTDRPGHEPLSIDNAAKDTERLIQFCVKLLVPAAEPYKTVSFPTASRRNQTQAEAKQARVSFSQPPLPIDRFRLSKAAQFMRNMPLILNRLLATVRGLPRKGH